MTQIEPTIQENIVDKLLPLNQIIKRDEYKLGNIPNLHSLMPYVLKTRKPAFDCIGHGVLKGSHITTAKDSKKYFTGIVNKVLQLIN